MSRPYETVLILDSTLDEGQVAEKTERFQRILSGDGKAPVQVADWGKRKLAYPIGKKEQGHYILLRYETDPDTLNEFERVARLDEQVLRHLTVVNPPESSVVGAEAAALTGRESRAESGEE